MLNLIFDKNNTSHALDISNDISELYISNVNSNVSADNLDGLYVELEVVNLKGSKISNKFHLYDFVHNKRKHVTHNWGENNLIEGLDLPVSKINISISEELNDKSIVLWFQFQNYISIEEPLKKFELHLQEFGNSKILFSAPFGQGKTTFIKLFFSEQEEKYNVIHLFPINYSIAENKDIFEYLKCEILLKLLERGDLEYDKTDFKYIETLPDFALKNADKILAPFLKLIPHVGGSLFSIYEELKKLSYQYFGEHENAKTDDKAKAISYIQRFIEHEGSLFEDNFISLLIRQLLEQVKLNTGKENILVIDDLDRIDPEHIFRILNVFAAHYDSEDVTSNSNKFGFDKIILVCDYSNLNKIFNHKYGSNTDFAGYINKFFSNSIYAYDNILAAMAFIEHIHEKNENHAATFKALLIDLFLTENLTLRELHAIKKNDYLSEVSRGINQTDQDYITLFRFLNKFFGFSELKKRIKSCRDKYDEKVYDRRLIYDYLTKDAFIELYSDRISNHKIRFKHNNQEYTLQAVSNMARHRWTMSCLQPQAVYIKDEEGKEKQVETSFTGFDFYNVLLMILEKYPNKF